MTTQYLPYRLSLLSAFITGALSVNALAAPSQNPLFLQEGVAPNLIVTLDDSGSMAYAYTPDSLSSSSTTARFRAASFNPMYYNPDITYTPPRRVTYNAATSELSVTPYPTSFTAAWHNGFRTNQGSRNLSNSYRVNTSYTGSGTPSVNQNPQQDFYKNQFGSISQNGGTRTWTSPGGLIYTVTRTGNSSCTATVTHPTLSTPLTPSCSTNNNYTVDMRSVNVPAYYYVKKDNCNDENDDACYNIRFVTTAEQQNFANWYSFYRTRHLATASAANLAFASLPENVRVTWQMLNNCASLTSGTCSGATGTTDNRLRLFAGNHRQNFFTWLSTTPASGGTPLRSAQQRAGNFLATPSNNIWNPYAHTPGTQLAPQHACRPSYHILMTDGFWNEDSGLNVGNIDNTAITRLPGQDIGYSPRAPYKDSTSNTVADLAFRYWSTDARTDLDNKVPTYIPYEQTDKDKQFWDARNNPANWQHLVTFTMGLGLGSVLTDPAWEGSTFAGTQINQVIAGTKSWPTITSNTQSTVYDLWHAAINSRGEFFSAESPEQLVSAFRTILNRIADRETSAASVGVESAVSSLDNEAYYARFSSSSWTGELIKYDVDSNNRLVRSWNARDLLDSKAPGSRNIKFNNGGSLTNFTWNNLPTDKRALLNYKPDGTVDDLGSQRVEFLRGGMPSNLPDGTDFRTRKHRLGDIVHSSPVVVGAPDRLASLMNPLSPSGQTYLQFQSDNRNRAKRIYVGANDGMLHGFDANGEEVFAFIPTAVFPNLHLLTDPSYDKNHHFYVDGTPIVNDVVINGQWRTVLVGTLRAGGRGLYALDITDPNNISLLWEFTSQDDQDLGYTFAQPTITRLATGDWAVIIGNGYNSTNNHAALFVLDMETGDVVRKLVVENSGAFNGLSTPRTVDLNGDLITDYVYAGDLLGNLWRFDFMPTVANTPGSLPTFTNASSNMLPSSIKTSFAGAPLYIAQNNVGRQPISTAPNIIRHPAGIGFIVAFGTGKYFESADANADTTQAMTLYGILDRQLNGFTASTTPTLSRSNLQQQTIGVEQTETFSDTSNGTATNSKTQDIRMISQNPVDWNTQQGWYMDLAANGVRKGEMIVTDMTSRASVLFATSIVPNDDPCASGIDRWFFGIDAITGGRTTFNVLDTSGNKIVDAADAGTGGVISNIKIPGFGSPVIVGDEALFNMPNGAEGITTAKGPYELNRQSWRVIGD